MSSPHPSPHISLIHARMPTWLYSASADQRARLQQRIRDSLRATRQLREVLARVKPIDAFCRPLLIQAMARWYPAAALPDADHGMLRRFAPLRDASWLEAAMQNFDDGEAIRLHASSRDLRPLPLDPASFVKGARNLDLGRRYQDHLREHLDTDDCRQRLYQQDRAAFAAELTLARLEGRIDSQGELLGEALLNGQLEVPQPESHSRPVECAYLSLFGIPLHGPLLIRLAPRDSTEPCLLYLPGAGQGAVRQYSSLQALGEALTRDLWDDKFRHYFSAFVSNAQFAQFADRLRQTLYPRYPYSGFQQTPVLEKGQSFSWLARAFPPPRSIWLPTLDKNARLPWSHDAWPGDPFAARARHRIIRTLRDAAAIAVPVAERDQAVQDARIAGWLQLGLNVANVASLFIPALGAVMMVVGASQVVDEFLEGVHALNDGDGDAAVQHLFGVFESLIVFAALGAGAHYAEVAGPLQQWHPIEQDGAQRLWNGDITPFARKIPWQGEPAAADGFIHWKGRPCLQIDEQVYPLQRGADARWRLQATPTHRASPALRGHLGSVPVLEHEHPLSWAGQTLLRRMTPARTGLQDDQLERALRSSGYSEAQLRQRAVDHQPLPALLLDSLQARGARGLATAPPRSPAAILLSRQFPSLGDRACAELLAAARTQDLRYLERAQRIPLAVAEAARLAVRTSRLTRALDAFDVANGAEADRDLIVLRQLTRLPGWSARTRLELRLDRTGGALLAQAGTDGVPAKVIVRRADRYRPHDETGLTLSNDTDLFQAILQALPDAERRALGVDIHEPQRLNALLFALAAADREGSAQALGMQPIRPLLRFPSRAPGDARLGYRLSGRGQGWDDPDALFDELYPASPETDRHALREHLRGQAGEGPQAFSRLLQTLRDEYRRLDSALELWVDEPPTPSAGVTAATRRSARIAFSQALRQAWRRETVPPSLGFDRLALQLDGSGIGRLPTLPDRMPHVRALILVNLDAGGAANLGGFLEAFPALRHLDLTACTLSRLPPQLGQLSALEDLDLSQNLIDLQVPENVETIANLMRLRRLNLTNTLPSLPPSALQRWAQLPRLQALQLDANELELFEQHVQALEQWPALSGLSLRENNITLTPQTRMALARLNRLEQLYLGDNPLDLAPDVSGWVHLRVLDLQDTEIIEWPEGLSALLDQDPLRLRQLDLSENLLSQVPPLAGTRFAEAAAAGGDTRYNFDENPLDDPSLQRLSEAGLAVAARQPMEQAWFFDWPMDLLDHVSETAEEPLWHPLYALFARLPDTAEYQQHPQLTVQRMQHVLRLLSEPGQAGAEPWGRGDLLQRVSARLEDAAQTCVDQASLLFQQTENDVLMWQMLTTAAPTASDTQAVVQSAAGVLRQHLLDERIARLYDARVARRRALAEGAANPEAVAAAPLHANDDLDDATLGAPNFLLDEVEIQLDARRRLQARLNLPAQPQEMAFGYLARLSDATLDRLGAGVLAEFDQARFVEWAIDQPLWRDCLQRLHRPDFQALDQLWEGAVDYHSSFSEASSGQGAYVGAPVPETYLLLLEQQLGDHPGLRWREGTVVQRVDLVSGRYANENEIYRRASDLLLQARTAATEALNRTLTQSMAQRYLG
ncbi:hypothetical protein IAE35_19345 [Pseudomonas sp. S75]|uniref:dermonecrotic toxin domain-containing protein n=1 Tax=unclassified Pseudomonas TaxID=196821 RepID=UPI0019040416|nr:MULTISPECIES: DUF6543 domain-containing protein [unclassified Pseudomonas]MBJ9977261.1 hypothetical protein [Pseudomonas sp. S30]MBK0155498.1 hypothetical protein [Pseudomonas sp. S75]